MSSIGGKARRHSKLAHASHERGSLLSYFLRRTKTCGWLMLILVISSNILLFLVGSSIDDGSDITPGTAPMWTSMLQLPPEGRTCEEWLTEKDTTKEARNFMEEPVIVHAREDRVYPCDGTGCHYIKSLKGKDCDADLIGNDANCAFKVLRQETPDAAPAVIDASNLVAMGFNLDSDVPIGQPAWRDYPFMAPVGPKSAQSPIVAILNTHCLNTQTKFEIIWEFWRLETKVELFGKCFNNRTAWTKPQDAISRYKFSLVFEDYAGEGYMSEDYWLSLATGVVPIVVSEYKFLKFIPADNAYLHVQRVEDVKKVADWVAYLLRYPEAYNEMLRWKEDWPADAFLALLDMAAVGPECRLCIHLATRMAQAEAVEQEWPCRCLEGGPSNQTQTPTQTQTQTLYHVFIRERGRFTFHPLFLRSSELTVSTLVKSVYRLFKSKGHQPIWTDHRPEALSGAVILRAFRIYPVAASQEMALQGSAAFRTDNQFRAYIEATPCPQLEVIFL